METGKFQQLIRQQGQKLFRPMPWRDNTSPYYILVSELMLQQTQVDRVIPKFNQFMWHFPTVQALAAASLADVLPVWQGLGYNRRAKYLHQTAQTVVVKYNGLLPNDLNQLKSLSGIGPNTAAAIVVYAFNQPAVFIETNIRTVYIHHFLGDDFNVSDKQIFSLLEQTIDRDNPRQFYWSIMDYGTHLKQAGIKAHRQSKHYAKQSPLEGSVRQMRGQIIKQLAAGQSAQQLRQTYATDPRFSPALDSLVRDGLVEYGATDFKLAK